MSQKSLEMKETGKLNGVFDPSDLGVFYYNTLEIEFADKKKKKAENEIYNEVVNGLKLDMIESGARITYSSEILIREVAMNNVLMNRIKTEMICRNPLRKKQVLKQDVIRNKRNFENPRESSKSFFYDVTVLEEDEIHPLFDKFIPKLQKQINDGLKALGLLPSQLMERDKVVIVKKLRQRYENLCGEVSIEARKEIKRKIIHQEQSNPRPVETQDLT